MRHLGTIGLAFALSIGSVAIAQGQALPGSLWACEADGTSGNIYELDPDTGAILQTIAMTLDGTPLEDDSIDTEGCMGLAFEPGTQTLYGLVDHDGDTDRALVTIDVTTGAITVIGEAGGGDGDYYTELAFGTDGTLYGLGGCNCDDCEEDAIYIFDKTTGETTFLTDETSQDCGPNALAFNADDGFLYQVADETYRVDPATGTGVEISDNDDSDNGIAWDPVVGRMVGTDDSGLQIMDTTDGTYTDIVGSSIGTSDTRGFAFAGVRNVLEIPVMGFPGALLMCLALAGVATLTLVRRGA